MFCAGAKYHKSAGICSKVNYFRFKRPQIRRNLFNKSSRNTILNKNKEDTNTDSDDNEKEDDNEDSDNGNDNDEDKEDDPELPAAPAPTLKPEPNKESSRLDTKVRGPLSGLYVEGHRYESISQWYI